MNKEESASGFGTGITVLLFAAAIVMLLFGIVAVLYLKSFDTQYAPGYSEKKFKSIKIGATEQSVLSLLGGPISTDNTEPFVRWIYSADKQRHFSENGAGSGTYTTVQFDSTEQVISISGVRQTSANSFTVGEGQGYLQLTSEQIKELKDTNQEAIRQKFGSPVAVYEYKASKVLRYSQSPSSSNYHLRMVGVDKEGKVVHMWSEIYWD